MGGQKPYKLNFNPPGLGKISLKRYSNFFSAYLGYDLDMVKDHGHGLMIVLILNTQLLAIPEPH